MFWLLFSLDFTVENAALGLLICLLVSFLSRNVFFTYTTNSGLISPLKALKYFLLLVYEIYLASFHLILMIIKKEDAPIVFEMELDIIEPHIITLIANSITLTPGTITILENISLGLITLVPIVVSAYFAKQIYFFLHYRLYHYKH